MSALGCTRWVALGVALTWTLGARAQGEDFGEDSEYDDSASMSFDTAEADELDAQPSASADEQELQPAEGPEPSEEPLDDTAEADVGEPELEPEPEPDRAELRAKLGFGMGMLALSRPTELGRQSLPRASFAAVNVELGLLLKAKQRVSYDMFVAYHSSLGFGMETEPLYGLDQRVAVRNQRVELVFAPILRLGASPSAWSLSWPVGFVLRSLNPKLHQFGLPDQLLAGPELRVELRVPLGDVARLRLAPELIWFAFVDSSLRDEGACCQGVAAGGVAALEADIGASFRVSLDYRESHAFVGSGERAYNDMERYLTAALTGRF